MSHESNARPGVVNVMEAMESFAGPHTSSWLVGEPCFDAPEVLRLAMVREAGAGRYPYSPPAGIDELRRLLARSNHCGAEGARAEMVTVTHGAKGGLLLILSELLGPDGGEVICPVPCFPSYRRQIEALGGEFVPVAARHAGPDDLVRAVRSHVGPRTRAVLLSSPGNPSGVCLGSEDARRLVEMAREHGLSLICDEVYEGFRFTEEALATPAVWDPEREIVVQLRSVSKSYAMCGARIGFVLSSPPLARLLALRQSALLNPPSTLSQRALLDLEEVPAGYREEVRKAVADRITELIAVVRGCGIRCVPPAGGFYLWLDLRHLLEQNGWASSREWCRNLAAAQGLALWPGEDFHAPGWARIAAVAPRGDEWGRALDHMGEALAAFSPRARRLRKS